MSANPPTRWQVAGILFAGLLAVSTAAIFIRLATAAAGQQTPSFSLMLAASRLLIAALLLAPNWRKVGRVSLSPEAWWLAGLAGICLALHFAAWITSLVYTSIAASTTLVTTNPIWVALLSQFWLKQPLARRSWWGIGIALMGAGLIGWGDAGSLTAGRQPLMGDGLALLGSWAVSFHILLGRAAQQRGLPLSMYVTVAYSVAALVLLPLPMLFGGQYWGHPPAAYGWIVLMALLPQLVGHTSFNWALRWLAPVWITLVVLFEPVISSGLGYLIFGEKPGGLVLLGAAILLLGVAIAALGSRVPRA